MELQFHDKRADWAVLLDRMDAEVARVLAAEPHPLPDAELSLSLSLEPLDHRIAELQACLERADRAAADTDALLRADLETLHRWISMMAQLVGRC